MPFEVVSAKGKRFMELGAVGKSFAIGARAATRDAAKAATEDSRGVFNSLVTQRPFVPARPRRPTTQGNFPNLLLWEADRYGGVNFDRQTLEESAGRYWLIQEIGTGKTAKILGPGGETISVKSQKGRELPTGFYWGNAGGEMAQESGLHNLFIAKTGMHLDNGHVGSTLLGNGDPVRIERQIEGKHFVQMGGNVGLAVLEVALRDEFKRFLP